MMRTVWILGLAVGLLSEGCDDEELFRYPLCNLSSECQSGTLCNEGECVPDDDSGGPYDNPNADDIPNKWLDECPPEAIQVTDFQGGNGNESYVKSWQRTVDEGSFTVSTSAYYAVYNTYVYESGRSQPNESAYFRFRNAASSDGAPESGNCLDEWVVQDHDNEGPPPGDYIFVGVFMLQEGVNTVAMHHYCPLFRGGQCADFHHGDPEAEGGCESNNPNSAHFKAEGLCLLPWAVTDR